MICPTCGTEMRPLFFSSYCPKCEDADAPAPSVGCLVGYIVFRARPAAMEYVFETREGAETWRDAAGLDHFPIRRVRNHIAFAWRESSGTVQGIRIADRIYSVYDNETEGARHNAVWLSDD